MPLALRYLAHSEIGLVRKNNQDSAYTSPTMLVVADGMGGAAAGDLASAIAVRELRAGDGDHHGQEMLQVAGEAVDRAAAAMSELIAGEPKLDGMGSTVCGVLFDGEQFAVVNIGDSRAYRYRDRRLTRLTTDHSWVQSLVDEGRITEAEALEHPHRSLILRVINGQPQHQPDLELAEAAAGDRLLICSDGLCGLVTDASIAAAMDGDREQVMAALIGLAHDAGAQDNITIIIADVVAGDPDGPTEVFGAAAQLDLDDLMNTTAQLPRLPAPVGTAGDAELARYTPVPRRPRTLLKIALAVLLPLLVLTGAGGLWYGYTQNQYYVGANNETLAIFQGVPEPVFNLPLSTLVQTDPTRVADLPPYYQEKVRKTMPAESLPAARATLVTLRLKAIECVAQRRARQTATPTPAPSSPTPTGDPGEISPTATAPSQAPSGDSTPPAPTDC